MTEHLSVYCACCDFKIFIFPGRKLHVLTGCCCMIPPIICPICRESQDNDTVPKRETCKWCKKQGICMSFHENQRPYFRIDSSARTWHSLQTEFQPFIRKNQMVRRIMQHWNHFLHFMDCINVKKSYQGDRSQTFNLGFFRSWILSQLFENRAKISGLCLDTILDSRFFCMLKTITFARRVLTKKFFSSCPHDRMTQRMRVVIDRILLANVTLLFELSMK